MKILKYLPIALLVFLFVSRAIDETFYKWFFVNELGPGEIFTAIFFLVTGVLAFRIGRQGNGWLKALYYIVAAGGVVVAGEEISWGQHFFGWETPENYAATNKQAETNLHNNIYVGWLLDQQPRAILSGLIVLVGLVLPLLMSAGKGSFIKRLPATWQRFVPSTFVAPAAFVVIFPRILDRIQVWFDVALVFPLDVPTRHFQEFQELAISMFVVWYLLDWTRSIVTSKDNSPCLQMA